MMKQIVAMLTVWTLALGLCACSATQPKGAGEEPSQGPTWQEQYDLGVRYLSEGNYQEAIIAFTAAIEIDPKQAPAYVGRGDAHVLSGDTEENLAAAKADYEKAIELDETNPEAYLGLADVYMRQGDAETARMILEQGLMVTGDARLQERLDELDELEQQEGRPEGASETVTAIGCFINNLDEYDNTWQAYLDQYGTTCAIVVYGIRFESPVTVHLGDDLVSIEEALAQLEAINGTPLYDEVFSHSKSMFGLRMELTGHFCHRESSSEIVPEYREDDQMICYTYYPNGDYIFCIESYTLLD